MHLREAGFLRCKDGQRIINLQTAVPTVNNNLQYKSVQTYNISSSTAYNIIKRFQESEEISVHKGQTPSKSIFNAHNLWALRHHCIKNRDDSVMEHSRNHCLNTIHCGIHTPG